MHPDVSSSNVHNTQTVEWASVSIERWMDKEDVVYVYNGILLSHQKGQIPTICFNVDGTGGYYAEWNKSIGGQALYDLIHLGKIKIVKGNKGERRKNEWEMSERETEHERPLTLGKEQGVVEREMGAGRWGWLCDGHWGGHLMGWVLDVMVYVGKLNSN